MTKVTVLALGLCIMSVAGLLRAHENDNEVTVMHQPKDHVKAKLECLGGYLFAVAAIGGQNNAGRGVSIVQVFAPSPKTHLPPQPVLCK